MKNAISKKDDAINGLRDQLAEALQQLQGTEAVLAAQQAEFCDVL